MAKNEKRMFSAIDKDDCFLTDEIFYSVESVVDWLVNNVAGDYDDGEQFKIVELKTVKTATLQPVLSLAAEGKK